MKQYTIIGGVNGVGKSSLTGVLKARMDDLGVIIDVDRLVVQHGGDPLAGGRAALARIADCLEKGICFTQETTLSGRRTEQTAKEARERGYRIRLYYIGLDTVEESLRRIENRVRKGGHDIPSKDVQRRFEGRFAARLAVRPYCDEATLFDNDNGFVEVGSYRNGELRALVPHPPAWFADLLKAFSEQ